MGEIHKKTNSKIVEVQRPAICPWQPAVLSEDKVLQPCDWAIHPGGYLTGGMDDDRPGSGIYY